jgi:hypothetical protein
MIYFILLYLINPAQELYKTRTDFEENLYWFWEKPAQELNKTCAGFRENLRRN